jgi:heavy metal sensor kinase
MGELSIRLRLTIWYSAVLLLGLVLFASGMWLALEHRLIAGVDARLAQRVQGLRAVLEMEGGSGDRRQLKEELSEFAKEVPDGTAMQVRDEMGTVILSPADQSALPAFVAGPLGYRTSERDGPSFRIFTTRLEHGGRSYEVVVAALLDEVRAVMRDFRNLLLMMVPAVLAAACLGGYWISRHALAPVDEITRVAKSISVQNLSRRLVVPKTGDELQRMSETWNAVLERLDGAVKRIRQFTADASHELRTPVALIRATAELALRREREPEQYQKSLRDIEDEAKRMTELTESLLTVARADANGLDMPLTPTDLNRVLAEVVRRNEAVAEAKGIALRVEVTDGAASAAVNEPGIRRLMLILIDNAFKHTLPGGTVTLSTAARANGIILSVRDSGEGIEAADLPHIFERFYRADKSRGGSGGAGLGLSIAQIIARAHGSEIEVESAPGSGSCFRLTLHT